MSVRLLRFCIGRALIHAGLRMMPPGQVRAELSALLWTWGLRVQAAVTADRARRAGGAAHVD